MFDDIALNPKNPKRGVIINRPGGEDVYQGVPKVLISSFVHLYMLINEATYLDVVDVFG